MVPVELTATCGLREASALFETFVGEEKTSWALALEQFAAKPRTVTARTCPQRLRRTMTCLLCASSGLGNRGPQSSTTTECIRILASKPALRGLSADQSERLNG